MSALRAAVAHANRHLPTLYVPRVIPSPRILPRGCVSDVIFIFNSSFAFLCRTLWLLSIFISPQSFGQAAQEYVRSLVISMFLYCIKGALPPLEWSRLLLPSLFSLNLSRPPSLSKRILSILRRFLKSFSRNTFTRPGPLCDPSKQPSSTRFRRSPR